VPTRGGETKPQGFTTGKRNFKIIQRFCEVNLTLTWRGEKTGEAASASTRQKKKSKAKSRLFIQRWTTDWHTMKFVEGGTIP